MILSTSPLSEARQVVENGKDDGIECPCCGQFVRRYRRKITSAMAWGLILIHNHCTPNHWVHLREFFTKQNIATMNDLPTLKHWNLIEPCKLKRDDGNAESGLYRITEKGVEFVRNKIVVPRYCYIFNDERDGFGEETTSIMEALGDKFNYSGLVQIKPDASEISQLNLL